MCRQQSLSPCYVSSSVIRSLYTHLESQLGSQNPALIDLGIREYELNDTNFRFSASAYLDLINLAVEQLEDDSFGFHYGQLADTNRWGVMGYLLAVSENIKQLLLVKSKYQALVDNIGCTLLHRADDAYIAEWYTDDLPNKHLAEETITSWVCFGRMLTNNQIKPIKISFRHPCPVNKQEYEEFFKCEVAFGQAINAVTFPKSVMDVSIKQSDKRMFEALNIHAGQLLEEAGIDNLKLQIRAFIIRELPRRVPSIDLVAKRFNVSVRSLQRHFEMWGTNFKQFVDLTREEVAIAYLETEGPNLMELTFLLGFSEQSAFQRAFKRWTGSSPKRYLEERLLARRQIA